MSENPSSPPERATASASDTMASIIQRLATQSAAPRAPFKAGLCYHASVMCTGIGNIIRDSQNASADWARMEAMNLSASGTFDSLQEGHTQEGIASLVDLYQQLEQYIEEGPDHVLTSTARMFRNLSQCYLSGDPSGLTELSRRVKDITDQVVSVSDFGRTYGHTLISLAAYATAHRAGNLLAGPFFDQMISSAFGRPSLARELYQISLRHYQELAAADPQPETPSQATSTGTDASVPDRRGVRNRVRQ